jgi:hypothetical protein
MIRQPAITLLASMAAACAADLPDMLRFNNDDQLRGSFDGMREGPQVIWRNQDLAEPAAFRTNRIRHIILRGGRPLKALGTLSHAGLTNGDQLPGTLVALDNRAAVLQTEHAGTLRIPREHITLLAPNPLGGRIHYHGPFSDDAWEMIHPSHPDGLPGGNQPAASPGRWSFSGAAWHWQHKLTGTALVRKSGMPVQSVLRFDLAWKNRLNVGIAINADFARHPAGKHGRDGAAAQGGGPYLDANILPRLFGNSQVLMLYSNYLTLVRTSIDANGEPSIERHNFNSENIHLGDAGRARIELRSNRTTGEIILFVNDEFTAQWNGIDMSLQPANQTPDGPGFGFVAQGGDSPVRISDIIISEWNGMPDSARSLQLATRDVVLMTNGTDRYAGKVEGLDADGLVVFEGRHGRFRFPPDEVAEIRFASSQLAVPAENTGDTLRVRLSPLGSVSGVPVPGEGKSLSLMSPIVGRLDLSMDSAVMIEFNANHPPIDDWSTDF